MNNKRKPIPQFSSEDEEREFWATHDSAEYLDCSKAERNHTFSRLQPSTMTVSILLYMLREKVQLGGYRCKRCGHEWLPRKPKSGEDPSEPPRICPKCKSPYWDI